MKTETKQLLKAIGYAFVFGFIGVGVWILIGGFGKFISAWIAFGIAYGIWKGYEIADGPKKWKLLVCISLYILQIFIACYFMFYFIVTDTVYVGFFEVFGSLGKSILVARDYILIGTFSALGLVFLVLFNIDALRRKLNMKKIKQQ